MKSKLLLLSLFISFTAMGQMKKVDEYTTKSGKTIKVGDMVTIGKGSGQNQEFLYIMQNPGALSTNIAYMDRGHSGNTYPIIKIVKRKKPLGGNYAATIYLKTGYIKHYALIENALENGEIILK